MKFNVQVQKQTFSVTDIQVEALDENEAKRIAETYEWEKLEFNGYDEEYEIVSVEPKEIQK